MACIETGAQISKTFIPLKPLAEDQKKTLPSPLENSRYAVLEPISSLKPPLFTKYSDEGVVGSLTRSGRVEISSLQLNCHYSLYVAPDNDAVDKTVQGEKLTAEHAIPIGCLCTPACFDDKSMPWASHFSCTNKGIFFLFFNLAHVKHQNSCFSDYTHADPIPLHNGDF